MSAVTALIRGIWDWIARPRDRVTPWQGGIVFDPNLRLDNSKGIEVLNDDKTPMEFVVTILEQYLGMSLQDATIGMLYVHLEGAAKFGRMSDSTASELLEHIHSKALAREYPLECRKCEGQAELLPEAMRKRVMNREA